MTIQANQVKLRGVSLFDEMLKQSNELIINVRGKNRYVVLDIERYESLRESELDSCFANVMKEIDTGKYTTDIDEHLSTIRDAIK